MIIRTLKIVIKSQGQHLVGVNGENGVIVLVNAVSSVVTCQSGFPGLEIYNFGFNLPTNFFS